MDVGSLTKGLDLSSMPGPSGGIDLSAGQSESQSSSLANAGGGGGGGGGGPTLYYVNGDGFYSVDTSDGAATRLGDGGQWSLSGYTTTAQLMKLAFNTNAVDTVDVSDGSVASLITIGSTSTSGIAYRPSSGNLYYWNRALGRIQEYDTSGTFVRNVFPGSTVGREGIAFDPDDNMWIADTANDRIQRVDPSSGTLSIVETVTLPTDAQPQDLTFSGDGTVWVTSQETVALSQYSLADGSLVQTFDLAPGLTFVRSGVAFSRADA